MRKYNKMLSLANSLGDNFDAANQSNSFRQKTSFGKPIESSDSTITSNSLSDDIASSLIPKFIWTNGGQLAIDTNVIFDPVIETECDFNTSSIECENSLYMKSNFSSKSKVKLTKHGYYAIPSLSELDTYVQGKTCIVPNFIIGRKEYGHLYYPNPVDVYGLNLDDIVHFNHKEVIVYPDDNKKPPIGKGLNCKAQITLDRVWPKDKSSHQSITDFQCLIDLDYENKLREISKKHGILFLEYKPKSGSWVFQVEHFTKYGLDDSDDEEEDLSKSTIKIKDKLSKKIGDHSEKPLLSNNSLSNGHSQIQSEKSSDSINNDIVHQQVIDHYSQSFQETEAACSPTALQIRLLGTNSHDLQLMKASFFDHCLENSLLKEKGLFDKNDGIIESENPFVQFEEQINLQRQTFHLPSSILEKKAEIEKTLLKYPGKTYSSTESLKVLPPPIVEPKSVVLRLNTEMAPYETSPINRIRSKCIVDAGIYFGRMFRVGWGPNLTFISHNISNINGNTCTTVNSGQPESFLNNPLDDLQSSVVIKRVQIHSVSRENEFQGSLESHLFVQLDASHFEENESCPLIKKKIETSAASMISAHKDLEKNLPNIQNENFFTRYFYEVWKLCDCLWGYIPNIPFPSENSHAVIISRKESLSDWFQTSLSKSEELKLQEMNEYDEIIFSLITHNKLEEACKKLKEKGDYNLALLVSQLNGSIATKELIKQQVKLWLETNVTENISIYRFKIFMLIAGIPLITQEPFNEVNLAEEFEWKKSFAVYLWYICNPVSSLSDVLDAYDSALQSKSISEPCPGYYKDNIDLEIENEKPVYDMHYHLLKLYCFGNHPMETVINPQTYTYDSLDYKLSWLLYQILSGLGYTHLSEDAVSLLHINFATQLESCGLWYWSIFILLHLQDNDKRCKAVTDFLERHVQIEESQEYNKHEQFLEEKLHIPTQWINRAKAIKSFKCKRYGKAAWFYAKANDWNKSHEIIIEFLVADAIINENYEYIQLLLSLFPQNCNNLISGWSNQGQLILDYMKVTEEISRLLDSQQTADIGYHLELLHPELASLCTKVNAFPCPTVKHRLCQAEIAKKTIQLARSLFILHYSDNHEALSVLINLISELPMPEDYVHQELRPVIDIRTNEFLDN